MLLGMERLQPRVLLPDKTLVAPPPVHCDRPAAQDNRNAEFVESRQPFFVGSDTRVPNVWIILGTGGNPGTKRQLIEDKQIRLYLCEVMNQTFPALGSRG
jgi:hypothetical protein